MAPPRLAQLVASVSDLEEASAQRTLLAIKYAGIWHGSSTVGDVTEPVAETEARRLQEQVGRGVGRGTGLRVRSPWLRGHVGWQMWGLDECRVVILDAGLVRVLHNQRPHAHGQGHPQQVRHPGEALMTTTHAMTATQAGVDSSSCKA